MTIKIYFIESKTAGDILKKYKEEQALEEFVTIEINGKEYYLLECDFSLSDYKPYYIESDKCFDDLREESETYHEIYTI